MAALDELLADRLAPAFERVAGELADPVIRRSRHADFQADGALALARRLGENPRVLADRILEHAVLDDLGSAEVSGPGFISVTFAEDVLGRHVAALLSDERLGVPTAPVPDRVVVDYSAPNVAKEMHVGHLRSTIIGDAIVRLLEWLGHTVIRQNHIGDWGTPFGMLIEHLLDLGETEAAHELSVGDLDSFYKTARAKFDADDAFKARARQRVVALQSGDPQTLRLWQILVGESKRYFMAVYDRLDVRLTEQDFFGESQYNEQLPAIVDELDMLGLLEDSDGARCAFPAGFTGRDGASLPMIVKKRDGGFGYPATDLATIRHSIRELHASRLLYVIGLPQRQHMAMIYAVAREAGWLTDEVRVEHVGHGSILGPDGKPLRSRAGHSAKLIDLLDEAVERAEQTITAKNPELEPDTRARVAQAVGIGAMKYADLSSDRVRDYVFDYDRMLAFEGNTAPYLQYAHARIRSIFRRAGTEADRDIDQLQLSQPEDRALAIELLAFPGVVTEVADSLELHRLAHYLHRLATTYTSLYERHQILRADPDTRASRLALSDLTARTLHRGLALLGISAPDRM
jgi:arginyl-tRNA synthetase